MSYMPRNAATTVTWGDLVDEFDRWEAAGRIAAFWWRDDDAVAPTAALSELLDLAGSVPLGLAVIPGLVRPELAAVLRGADGVTLLQHGWLHVNRAPAGKKSEYPSGRAAAEVTAEIAAGRARLGALFGSRAVPVFVPPWNRMATELVSAAAEAGMVALSAMAAGKTETGSSPLRLPTRHVHLDLTAWKGDRPESAAPIGILTHHLIMDRATAEFMRRLIEVAASHRAVRWQSPAEAGA